MSSSEATTQDRPRLRSLLFIPANRSEWLPKASAAGADAVIFDLEDAVPLAERLRAKDDVVDVLTRTDADSRPAVFVRIPAIDDWTVADYLRDLVRPGLAGVMLPKVVDSRDIALADRLLTWSEAERGLPVGTVTLIPLLETAVALRFAYDIATSADRIAYLGAVASRGGDVERALGYRWSPTGTETLTIRSQVLLDARAAGMPHPVAGLWTTLRDLEGLRTYAEQNRALGYTGMLAIHPDHVPVINDVFSMREDEIDRLERLIATAESATAAGQGAVAFEGEMVDEAMVATARRTLRQVRGTDVEGDT